MIAPVFETPFWLAPMEGVTHPAFRDFMSERGGIGICCTEFVRITDTPYRANRLARVVSKPPRSLLSVQVMGKNLENLRSAARIVEDAGADIVDLNLGCPSPKAVRGGVGSAMLDDNDLLARVVRSLRDEVKGTLSVKMRAGVTSAENVVETAKLLEDCGADILIVHPRRTCDGYKGTADWNVISRICDALTIPVIGNGDVWYAADAIKLLSVSGVRGIMIGRGALRNPFIFRQIAALRKGEEQPCFDGDDLFAEFMMLVGTYETAFKRIPIGKLKEIIRWLSRTVAGSKDFRQNVLRHTEVAPLLHALEENLAGRCANELDIQPDGHLQLEASAVKAYSARA